MTQQIRCWNFVLLFWGPSQSYHLFSHTGPSLTHWREMALCCLLLSVFLNSHQEKQLLNSCGHLRINVSLACTVEQSLLTHHQRLQPDISWIIQLDQAIIARCSCGTRKWRLALIRCCVAIAAAHNQLIAWIEWRISNSFCLLPTTIKQEQEKETRQC